MTETMEKLIINNLRERGFEYTAKYAEMFGAKNMCPTFWKGPSEESERFYKRCVEKNHPWDWYFDLPDGAIL